MTKYYKITNEQETHKGLQYHDGLNVDPVPFYPHDNCEPGGIYFASVDILAFLHRGPWIREVIVPEGEEIYTNPGTPVKYKAHQVILKERREITLDVIKELVADGCNPHVADDFAIYWAAKKGKLEIVKYLVSIGCDPRAAGDSAIQGASLSGHLETVKYLASLGCDPRVNNNYAIKDACHNGHLEVVEYLKTLGCE